MLTFYTNLFIPSRFVGCTYGPIILIRPEYRNDRGLLEHERVHRKQWIRTLAIHPFFYTFSSHYRLRSEAEAYAKQIEYSGVALLDYFTNFIVTKYRLSVTRAQAKQAIISFLPEAIRATLLPDV